jgi:hypothetical protein
MYDNLSARVGTSKLQNTLENARRISTGFERTIRTRRGKNALHHVRLLIAEVEKIGPIPGQVEKTGTPQL